MDNLVVNDSKTRDLENKYRGAYIESLREWLGSDGEIFLYWKARVGLYAFLKAVGVGEGDEVILPAFTCVVVPNAIKYLGATPIYVDIDLETYNARFDNVFAAVTDKTKVIICQNTFGLSSDIKEVSEEARARGILTVEDCAHGFGGSVKGVPNGLSCDAAIYSTQWSKPFSTGLGGILLCRKPSLSKILNENMKDLTSASFRDRFLLGVQLKARRHLMTNSNYWFLLGIFRLLSKYGVLVGSSDRSEVETVEVPEDYFKAFTELQAKVGLKNISNLLEDIRTRKSTASVYTQYLSGKGKNHVANVLFVDHSFLKYPLLVKNRDEFKKNAELAKIPLGEWFNSQLHPVQGDLAPWGLVKGHCPNSEFAAAGMVNLPTTGIDPFVVVSFLDTHLDSIATYKESISSQQ